MGQKIEHVCRGDLRRVFPHNGEERIQVKRHRPHSVRPAPARHELEIPVHQPVAQLVTNLARSRHSTLNTREAAHLSTQPGPAGKNTEATRITRVLSDRRGIVRPTDYSA